MIDFSKPIECDNGTVYVLDEMGTTALIMLTDKSGNSIAYWVSADGIPQPDFLDDSFNVRNTTEE